MKDSSKGIGFYVLIIALVILFVYMFRNGFDTRMASYSYQRFEEALENKEISYVEIHPNEQVPTGQLLITLEDNDTRAGVQHEPDL